MNSAAELIRHEIKMHGPISCARFMELALYAPGVGYYERQQEIGRRGDFYTSVSIGPLFGELLAFQLVEWLGFDGNSFHFNSVRATPLPFSRIVEAGAHTGQLAADILISLQKRHPALLERMEYWILEPSSQHQTWQKEKLAPWIEKIRWFRTWDEMPPLSGVILSNELLDAMPVHRFGWNAAVKGWFEWVVEVDGTGFKWMQGNPAVTPFVVTEELANVLPGKFTVEFSPAANAWWQAAANHLTAGSLAAIDYGVEEEELFHPQRAGGTLRAYAKHKGVDPLTTPGDCDVTVHVNFSALQRVGEAAGLTTTGLISQARFLTQVATRMWKAAGAVVDWDGARTRQFQTLTHPEHLGRPFKVLQQGR